MKRLILWLSFFILTPVLVLTQNTPITVNNTDSLQLEAPSYNNRIQNLFASINRKDLPSLFKKNILIENISSVVPTLESGTLIYLDTPSKSRIPESTGNDDLAVIENNNQVRYYYSKFVADPTLSHFAFRNIKEPMELGKTNFSSSLFKSFSLEVSKSNIFLNPILFLKPSQLDNREKKFIIGSVLIESGIYNKFINSERSIRIPLRKDYNIYVYAFEQAPNTLFKSPPRSITLEVSDTQTGNAVFNKTVNFSNIQTNKLNNQFTADETYRKYNTIQMLKIGNWSERNRLSSYNFRVKATSFYGLEDTMAFQVEFY